MYVWEYMNEFFKHTFGYGMNVNDTGKSID